MLQLTPLHQQIKIITALVAFNQQLHALRHNHVTVVSCLDVIMDRANQPILICSYCSHTKEFRNSFVLYCKYFATLSQNKLFSLNGYSSFTWEIYESQWKKTSGQVSFGTKLFFIVTIGIFSGLLGRVLSDLAVLLNILLFYILPRPP